MRLAVAILGLMLISAHPSLHAISAQRRAAVEREVAALGTHPWAGAYVGGGGRLDLAPTAGFVFQGFTCRSWPILGYVVDEGDRLHLWATEGDTEFERELLKVTWGDRLFLVEPDDIQPFCNAFNLREAPRVLEREGLGSVYGRPHTVAGPLECLLDRPIRTRIVAVLESRVEEMGDNEWATTTVRLGVGRRDGVRVGMAFRFYVSGAFRGSDLIVDEVDEDAATATVSIFDLKGLTNIPRARWPVSTQAN